MAKKICFYDTKPYDKIYFDLLKDTYEFENIYLETKLNKDTAILAKGADAVVIFVNDTLDKEVIDILYNQGIGIIALRCSGYNNVDFKYAKNKITIVRVPFYSPYAIAEHAMGMILTLNRKLHRASNRVKEYNFSLNGLLGNDLFGKTVGIIGTGKIGRTFIDLCNGFGMNVLAYDPYKVEGLKGTYVELNELFERSDIISLHCPLTKDSYHIIDKSTIKKMKDGVMIINTSRGALIDSEDLVENLKSGKIGAAGLDVYEEETEFFFEDFSDTILKDDTLVRLIAMPNVLITSHQAYFTHEALLKIAETTYENLIAYFNHEELVNKVES
jgi:D-lactate dehydrogenase